MFRIEKDAEATMDNCRKIQSQMIDYAEGHLTPNQSARIQAHLAGCASCAESVQAMHTVRQTLQGLKRNQTSAHFDSALAARLVQTHHERRTWADRWEAFTAPRRLRPALALGLTTCAVAGALFLHTTTPPLTAAQPNEDAALISQCVAVHQRDVAAQPLTDPTAPGVSAASSSWSGETTLDAAAQDNL
jgi:anti-sigma factor RsiW